MAHAKKEASLPAASCRVVRLGLMEAQAQNSRGAIVAASAGSTGSAHSILSLDGGSVDS